MGTGKIKITRQMKKELVRTCKVVTNLICKAASQEFDGLDADEYVALITNINYVQSKVAKFEVVK